MKTKENFHRNSSARRIIRIGWIAALLCLALFLSGKLIGSIVSHIFLPVYEVKHWIAESTAPLPVFIRSRIELLHEIDELKERISSQGGSETTIARLTAERNIYQELVGIHDSAPRIGAGVIARPPEIPYDLLLIDRGSEEGILQGGVVYHANDVAIGFVSAVFEHSSLVTLFSSPGVSATAFLFGPDIFVEMFGEGGGIMQLSVPQGIAVSRGDAVVLPGIGAGMIGLVKEVVSVSTEPEQRAYLTLSVPIQSVYAVGVSARTLKHLSYEEASAAVLAWDTSILDIDIPESATATSSASATPPSTP